MKRNLDWRVGFTATADERPQEWIPAAVPGAVQLDYARAKGWPPYQEGVNFKEYAWMEDVFWRYEAPLELSLAPGQRAFLHFESIDYRYRIFVGGECLCDGEGMFSPVTLDVSRFAGVPTTVEVLLYPIPKADDSCSRTQGRKSCKAVACYGWDWHPRLVSTGLWGEAYLAIEDAFCVTGLELSYVLAEDLSAVTVEVQVSTAEDGPVALTLTAPDGTVAAELTTTAQNGAVTATLSVDKPALWYPVGYGEQPRYTLTARTLSEAGETRHSVSRHVGFRRVRMVMNEGSWQEPVGFPKTRSDAPATLEVNGIRLFAKGTNWVNAQIFPSDMNEGHYDRLLTLAQEAHMNILRIWGGGFINKESFYDLCDQKGLMVWQEFPLACNEYPDDDAYLAVLKKEATAIVRRLRTHPSLVLWCGGNELLNNWSRMTDQHHALRLLNAVCYQEDRFTPYIMASPLNGMAHGHYLNYDEETGEEFIAVLRRRHNTAYTEFGSPGMADPAYLRTFMDEETLADCRPENEIWREHHGFAAWSTASWVRIPEAEYYFGGYTDTADLCRKTAFIQSMCYRSLFEEMRRQWPHCSMALNWCFNEPWPTAANNSLISWPDVPKPAYEAVKAALRPQAASLSVARHLWRGGECFTAGVWMLNDTLEELADGAVTVSYTLDGAETVLGRFLFPAVAPQSNAECGAVAFRLPEDYTGEIRLCLTVEGRPELSAEYTYLCRATKRVEDAPGALNQ